ncbi:eCIS core domain-containing protein [Paenibacillus sp. y28]|uniref:eCIS core domain-containing protein n=1 Tax=Paenibacillus sp. y28 TaxID=3129110 RepID=UPI00301658C0
MSRQMLQGGRANGRRVKGSSAPAQRSAMRAADGMLRLQQLGGNRAVQRMLAGRSGWTVQRMEIPEEEELQMKANSSAAAQRMEAELPEAEEEEIMLKPDPTAAVQRMSIPEEDELQMKPVQRKTNTNGMSPEVQGKMEKAFNSDFSGVKIHEGSDASEIGALAYTQGSDIHFAPGRYQPNTQSGQELLGHELAHVVQQRQGRVRPTTQAKGIPINDDAALEKEADQLGSKAARMNYKPEDA